VLVVAFRVTERRPSALCDVSFAIAPVDAAKASPMTALAARNRRRRVESIEVFISRISSSCVRGGAVSRGRARDKAVFEGASSL
jgi:hypothetical protein